MLWSDIKSSLIKTSYANASALPVTLDFVKEHARIATDIEDYDALLTTYIYAAEQLIEDAGTLLRSQSWRLTFQDLPEIMSGDFNLVPIHLHPRPNVTEVRYRKVDRTEVVLTEDLDYRIYTSFDPVLLGVNCQSTNISNVSEEIDAWEVDISLTVADVPHNAALAIAVASAYWFRNPEAFATKQFDNSTSIAFDGLVNSLARRMYS